MTLTTYKLLWNEEWEELDLGGPEGYDPAICPDWVERLGLPRSDVVVTLSESDDGGLPLDLGTLGNWEDGNILVGGEQVPLYKAARDILEDLRDSGVERVWVKFEVPHE